MTSDESARPPLEPATDGLDDPWPGDGAQAVHEPVVPDPPRKRSVELTTVAVVAILAAAGGFIGGAAWKGSGSSPAAAQSVVAGNGSTATTGANGAANGRPGFGGYGRGGFRGGTGGTGTGAVGRNGAVGQITAINGDQITIQDAQGGQVVVTTSSGTTFDVDQEGTIADLAPGDTVVVQGERSADGTIAATTIRSGPPGGFGGFGDGTAGAPGATTPTT